MKKLIFPVLFLLLFSCEKEENKTTFSFTNKYNETIYRITVYHVDPETQEFVADGPFGSLGPDETMAPVEVSDDRIEFIGASFSFDISPTETVVDYVSAEKYVIDHGKLNEFILSEQTEIYAGTTYYILNSSNTELLNVFSYYWNGYSDIETRSHATILPGKRSFHILTEYPVITLQLELPGLEGAFFAECDIIKNEINTLEITQEDVDYMYSLE